MEGFPRARKDTPSDTLHPLKFPPVCHERLPKIFQINTPIFLKPFPVDALNIRHLRALTYRYLGGYSFLDQKSGPCKCLTIQEKNIYFHAAVDKCDFVEYSMVIKEGYYKRLFKPGSNMACEARHLSRRLQNGVVKYLTKQPFQKTLEGTSNALHERWKERL